MVLNSKYAVPAGIVAGMALGLSATTCCDIFIRTFRAKMLNYGAKKVVDHYIPKNIKDFCKNSSEIANDPVSLASVRLLRTSVEGQGWNGVIYTFVCALRDQGLVMSDMDFELLLLIIQGIFLLTGGVRYGLSLAKDTFVGHSDAVTPSKLISKLLALLVQVIAVSFGASELIGRLSGADLAKHAIRLTDFVMSISRSTSGLITFFGLVVDFIAWVVDWIIAKCTRRSMLSQLLTDHKDFLENWVMEVQYLCSGDIAEKVYGDPSLTARVVIAARVGEQLRREMVSLNHQLKNQSLQILISNILKLRDTAVVRQLKQTCRHQPYVVWMAGDKGIGKSHLRDVLVMDLLEARNSRDPIVGNPVYGVQPGTKHWTGVSPSTQAITFDDFAVNSTPENIALQVEAFQRLKSDQIFIPEQAAVEEKGRPIAPRLVLVLSNYEYLTSNVCTAINQQEAFDSRVNMRIVARLKDEYLSVMDGGRVVTEKLIELFKQKIPQYEEMYVNTGRSCLEHLKFSIIPTEQPNSIYTAHKWMSYSELVKKLEGQYHAYSDSQDAIVATKIKRLESLTRVESDSPLRDHWERILSDSAVVISGLAPEDSKWVLRSYMENLAAKYYPAAKSWVTDVASAVTDFIKLKLPTMELPSFVGHGDDNKEPVGDPHQIAEALDAFKPVVVEDIQPRFVMLNTLQEQLRRQSLIHSLLETYSQCDHVKQVVRAPNYVNYDFVQSIISPKLCASTHCIMNEDLGKYYDFARCRNGITSALWTAWFNRCTGYEFTLHSRAQMIETLSNVSEVEEVSPWKVRLQSLLSMFWKDGRPTPLILTLTTAALGAMAYYATRPKEVHNNCDTEQVEPDPPLLGALERTIRENRNLREQLAARPELVQKGEFVSGRSVVDHSTVYDTNNSKVVKTSKGRTIHFRPKVITPTSVSGHSFCAIDNIYKQFTESSVHLTVTMMTPQQTLRTSSMKAFAVCGHTIITLKHLFPPLSEGASISIKGHITDYQETTCLLSNVTRNDPANSEFVFLTFPKRLFKQASCRVKRFIPFDKTDKLTTRVFTCDVTSRDTMNTTALNVLHQGYNGYKIVREDGEPSSTVDTVLVYNWGAPGKCMTPVVAHIDQPYIVGFHVAGSTRGEVTGIAETILREDVSQFCKCKPDIQVLGAQGCPTVEDVRQEIAITVGEECWEQIPETPLITVNRHVVDMTGSEVIGVLKPKYAGSTTTKTVFNKSAISALLDVHPSTVPGDLKPSKLFEGIRFHCQPPKPFPPDTLVEFTSEYTQHLKMYCQKLPQHVGVLSKDTAVLGVTGWPLPPVNSSTSTGFPFRVFNKAQGKVGAFVVDHDAKIVEFTPEFDRVYEHRLSLRRQGVRPATVFTDCLKDAKVLESKVNKTGSTRVFSVCSADYLVTFRQYFGSFLASFITHRKDLQHSIGINPDGAEWSLLAMSLQDGHDVKFLCGDYSKFGPRLMKEVLIAIKPAILAWYDEYQEDRINLEEDQRVRDILLDEMIYSVHVANGIVYRTSTGSPSGAPPTAPLNSMANLCYIYAAWRDCFLKRGYTELASFSAMLLNLNITTYGDDVVIGVKNGLWKVFNNLVIRDFLAQYDVKYTDINKGTNMRAYCDFHEVQFLKRGFLKLDDLNMWLAPIDESVIWDTCHWIRGKPGDESASAQNAEAAMLLAYGHGPARYRELKQCIAAACASAKLKVKLYSWELLHLVLNNELTKEHETLLVNDFSDIYSDYMQKLVPSVLRALAQTQDQP